MIPAAVVNEIQDLLVGGKLSQREIARRVGAAGARSTRSRGASVATALHAGRTPSTGWSPPKAPRNAAPPVADWSRCLASRANCECSRGRGTRARHSTSNRYGGLSL